MMWKEILLDKGRLLVFTDRSGERIAGIKLKCYKPSLM